MCERVCIWEGGTIGPFIPPPPHTHTRTHAPPPPTHPPTPHSIKLPPPADLLAAQVRVLVMNNAAPGSAHPELQALRARVAEGGDAGFAAKARAFVTFLDNPGAAGAAAAAGGGGGGKPPAHTTLRLSLPAPPPLLSRPPRHAGRPGRGRP